MVAASQTAYDKDVTYTITFTPEHLVPQNGYVEIELPKEVSVPDYSYTQSSCQGDETSAFGSNQITCEFEDGEALSDPLRLRDPLSADHFKMTILNAFRRRAVEGGQAFTLTLPGLTNPIQTVPTLSFKFRTYDQRGRLIDELASGVTIRMTLPSLLDIVLVELGDYTNAAETDYTVTLVPTVPVWQSNLILVTFPEQIELPASSVSLDCSTEFASLLEQVRCSYPNDPAWPRTVRIDLTFPPLLPQIDPLDRFSINFKNIKNPTTTQTTDSIQVRVTDQSYIANNEKLAGVVITTNKAYVIGSADVRAALPAPGVPSDYILNFYPVHEIQAGGGILVVYPPQALLVDPEGGVTAEVHVDGLAVDQDALDIFFDLSARAVRISNVVQTAGSYVPQ